MWVRGIPIYLGVATIVGAGIVTAAYAGGDTALQGSQNPAGGPAAPSGSNGQLNPPKVGGLVATSTRPRLEPMTAITFADDRGTTYILARELAQRLGEPIELVDKEKAVMIGDKKVEKFRRLFLGDALIAVRDVSLFEGTLADNPDTHELTITLPQGEFLVSVGKKRIEVDKATQELTGYQGDIVVIKTNISTGRPGHNTPNGEFVTGPKERIHYSHKYDNAPMPYAIQVNGDVFLHGYSSVPSYPASHGCVRIPLGRKNPAKYLYGWAERGIDTKIFGTFSWEDHEKRRRHKRRG